MALVGRHSEKRIIDRLLKSQESEFLAVYGRRRVGKTYLIREYLKTHIVFECTALLDITKEQQLLNFEITLNRLHGQPTAKHQSWLEAFESLGSYLDGLSKTRKGKKKVIFFDEIPWFDTPRAGFLPAFTQFWNSYCSKRRDILLVICGSAASWIINKVVKSRGGLHNRLTQTIRLNPFDLSETKAYLRSQKVKLQDRDVTQLFMIVGGVPYYLKQIQPGKGIPQILDDLFFVPNARLKGEFNMLYASLFKNHELHELVVKKLAEKSKGLTRKEIIKATKIKSGGGLTKVLQELEECGFLIKSQDYDKTKEDGLYRLLDEYSLFYFKFLEKAQVKQGALLYNSQSFKIWSGFAFENLCFKHDKTIANILGISGVQYSIYSFLDKGTEQSDGSQIDIVLDRQDNIINIIEAKYYNAPLKITKKMGLNIANKIASFKRKTNTKKSIFVTLITAMGVEENEHYYSWITNDIQIKDFFNSFKTAGGK